METKAYEEAITKASKLADMMNIAVWQQGRLQHGGRLPA